MGKSKLAPRPAHTIPRFKLCAAVLAVQMYELTRDDSKIVLGYIHNSSRRFYVYVSNRVTRIRRSTHPDQNPEDHATRHMPAAQLQQSSWHYGPVFLTRNDTEETWETYTFTLLEPFVGACKDINTEDTTITTYLQSKGCSWVFNPPHSSHMGGAWERRQAHPECYAASDRTQPPLTQGPEHSHG